MHATLYLLHRLAQIILPAMLLTGCGGSKEVVQTPEPAMPDWVSQRPRNASYYIGVGSASKSAYPLDYQSVARKNALNELASEIKVRVKGETFLNTLELNKNFSEEFIATISTSTDESIENYEMAGQWENRGEYWVYFRLSKAEYQRQKSEKKNLAMRSARDFYEKGFEEETRGNIPAAVDLYTRGLFSLRDYWHEVNEYQTETGKAYLDNDLYASMRRVLSGLTIVPGSDRIILSADNNYIQQFPLQVTYEGKPVRGISLSFTYQRDRFMKPRVLMTDQEGRAFAEVSHVSTTAKSNWLDVVIDLEPLLPSDLDRNIEKGLIRNVKADSKRIPIELVTPSFFIESDEKVYGSAAGTSTLASAFQSELVKRGMRISGRRDETDFRVFITSNTTEGGSSQGFTVAFLEMGVEVIQVKTGETIFKEAAASIKGLQLNRDAASIDAYKKGRERLESEIVKSLLDAIL